MILRSKRISSDEDFQAFAKHYQSISGNKTRVEHLQSRTCVRAFFDTKGEMCAGYSVNCGNPLVYMADLPADMKEHPLQYATENIVEGGGLWVERALSDFERGFVFIYASWEAYRMKKRYFMSGARNPKVAERQKYIYPHVLFEGPTEKFDYVCMLYCRRQYILFQIGLFISRYWIVQPIKKWFRSLKAVTT
ncbi:hypothetical protein L1D31_10070 [Vibrio sp. Isolate23]|uniref:hypothetical protein n=1 Tax=Vibrio sp. Isolate23 TaxID=2908533 RepID=UPI001EFE9227|nr:hypothetical protein [Vibrio sp. Isolate23]MCG9682919.1 hypothetical protein [Vibrio sp. Isolate23]